MPGQQAPSVFQHQPAVGREGHAAAAALHQGATQLSLQRLDAAWQRRLAEIHRFGGAGIVAVLGEGDEVAELA